MLHDLASVRVRAGSVRAHGRQEAPRNACFLPAGKDIPLAESPGASGQGLRKDIPWTGGPGASEPFPGRGARAPGPGMHVPHACFLCSFAVLL